MQVSDDLYLGNGQAIGYLGTTGGGNPSRQQGVGPLGRIAFRNIVPLAAAVNNIALAQHMTAATALTPTAGTGVTAGQAPDGSGSTVYSLDVARCVSLTSAADLSAITFTMVGFDEYGAQLTSALAGPNANTVVFPKAVKSVLSITPGTTDGANNVSVGTSDTFGLQWSVADAGYVLPRWAGALGLDTGTLITADTTSPATTTTGDVRGTYQPSTASDGVNRLIMWMHLSEAQVGYNSTRVGAIGVAQV